jgi:hypothetical protein
MLDGTTLVLFLIPLCFRAAVHNEDSYYDYGFTGGLKGA